MLPPGKAWEWPEGSFGDDLLVATATELARIESEALSLLDAAIALYKPRYRGWSLADYQDVAGAAVGVGVATVDGGIAPPCAGLSRVGARTWSERSRYILRVRYSGGASVLAALRAALDPFKQGHIWLLYVEG
ncbi:MAG: hypothetical protein CGU28_04175 [Candidatus Dactylopiibacterium carminicum]|uniref:Uncharacterized protein n=1 Tax=Candidatus Dactylopiibacterium carminicum TaxID=857335 RepID=A0A272EXI0_9RHOO|nr:hypothetical protein [Candidatus Dactylopiibacterium carminicum]KAF7600165.1 hypothetical protein BGI27_03660 [Candidatus Dactylopiibacterium carminicum]PAS94815.1 MAG: hypothetical protein CGU29_02640 [Candidatus Dactylopiibacterium carminicum]PAS97739.1 MAG: hypothetical protein CGU28_04175 [Candidatus Dactylopiibacterium carminicum]PAT00168.1 MAG: hypothetical protein BSR46_03690 [Candidatus Dactylopiibacterium carminicum]